MNTEDKPSKPSLSRLEIAEAIKIEAPNHPYSMPLFLAGELLQECRRQGLKNMEYVGHDYSVIVRIKPARVARDRIICPRCGKSISVAKCGHVLSHRNKYGDWCNEETH